MFIASRFADDFRDAAGFGWSVGEPTFDWPTLVKAKDKEIGRLSDAYRENLARSGAKLVEQRATVVDPHRVRLADGREISARHILIACGSRPVMPAGVKGLDHAISSNELFDLPVFPRRLVVVGGGYIAVEFASLFQRLGSQVTMVIRGPNLLRGFDEDMRNGMRDAMANAGIVHRFGCAPTSIEKEGDGSVRVTLSDNSVIEADQALFATGRNPYTKGLGLEAAGVELSAEHGAVKVNENLTSNVPSIHAIGDATHRVDLTPVAIREGHTLADRLFGAGAAPIRYDTIGSTVFGTPELGAVGLTESEALQQIQEGPHLQDQFPAAEGDSVRQPRAHAHEAGRRRFNGARRRRAYSRRRSGRDDSARRRRHDNGRDQGRLRRDDRRASHRRRGIGDHALRPCAL